MHASNPNLAATGFDLMESTDVGEGFARAREGLCRVGEHVGPYRVERTIGAGAMGVVYAAADPITGQRVAVKLMHPRSYYARQSSTASRRTDAWLRNEARALARLSHPNVVRVYGIGSERGRPYMAMELVEGQTLAAWLAQGDHGWEKTLQVCVDAAQGLAAAHRAGVLHGDFKPDNVMVARDGRVLVMDFGLARSMSREARTPTETEIPAISADERGDTLEVPILPLDALGGLDDEPHDPHDDTGRTGSRPQPGTPAYMAPELLAGMGGDARSDQFSLCVTMYKALFGQRPYGGRTPTEIAFRVGRSDLRRCPEGHQVPVWLHAVVTRGLAVNPADRWHSVESLLRVLARGTAREAQRVWWTTAMATLATLTIATVLAIVI